MEGQSDFEAAQLGALAAEDALHPVIPVSEPVGQIHVGQVEVRLGQRVRALRRQFITVKITVKKKKCVIKKDIKNTTLQL